MTRISAILVFLSGTLLLAAAKKYDERGNVIQQPESANTTATPATAQQPAATLENAPAASAAPAEASKTNETGVKSEVADEETQALLKQKNPLTKVYLENGQMYLRSARLEKALEFFKKSIDAGDDSFSREAKLQSLWLRARRGDAALESEAEGLDEKLKVAALLRIADGYHSCAREQSKKPDCINEAERIYAFVGELEPRSTEGKLARVRLGLLLLDAGRHEAALPHLTTTLLNESTAKSGIVARELPLDRAYFNLGQLYERPWYHRDMHKAQAAYKQVLKYPGSPYHRVARERLAYIERFGTGYQRP